MEFHELLKEELDRGRRLNRKDIISISLAAERYANGKNKNTDALILSYWVKLRKTTPFLADDYKKYFGINQVTSGQITDKDRFDSDFDYGFSDLEC